MSTLKVSTISPLGTDATKTITIGSAGDTAAGVFTNTPSFLVTLSADQSIATGTDTKVQWNSEIFDTDNEFDSSSNYRWTCGTTGKYLLSWSVEFAYMTDGKTLAGNLYKNGSEFIKVRPTTGAAGATGFTGSQILNCTVGDYFEIYVYHDYGSNRNLELVSYFSGIRVVGA